MKKVIFFSLLGILVLFVGCGGGGSDDVVNEGPSTNIVGLQFTEDNMEDAALIGLDLLMLFPELSRVIALIIDTIETDGDFDDGSASLDDALCQGLGGTATLTWSDLRDQGNVFLDLENCIISNDPVTGDFGFTEAIYNDDVEGSESLITQMTLNLDVMESDNGDTNTFNILGNFLLRVSRTPTNGSTTLFFRFGGRDVDPDASLTLSEDSDQIRFGCFFLSVSFDPDGDEGTFMLGDHSIDPDSIYGVIVANRELFEISGSPPGGNLADFEFVDSVPVSGNGIDFWGFLREDGCGAVGAPDGVGQAGTANMALYPSDTGVLALELYSNGFNQGAPDQTLYINWAGFSD
ncbi:hypothetical protein [Desulfatitalea alkaliphila]|uniref:Uncharacterized protein n=1 Tax=Desulfatitalea alkaliphila TaxID=2929485 RepID=A0AA41RA98_9BACT|nr:hypothetical protein [Desulfatitalea alkaliphila]MCJ8501548.1 hypothetical protein [Desulfatitalea alkaliphila]